MFCQFDEAKEINERLIDDDLTALDQQTALPSISFYFKHQHFVAKQTWKIMLKFSQIVWLQSFFR
jgi:hypothetical protein